jgi:hypothetical protein
MALMITRFVHLEVPKPRDHLPRLAVLTGAALAVTGSAQPAFASVSATPASGTPQLAATGTTEQARQQVQCGQTMYAVGSFTLIRRYSTTYARNNIFSFSAAAPYGVTSWNPNVNGVVNTIAFNGTNCSTTYIGGKFTMVHGTPATNIAAIRNGTFPFTGLCDVAAAFPASQAQVSATWINYTGCDSLYSTAADATTAYFGGHERWSQNPNGCNQPGPGAISAPGMEGLSPNTGLLTFNPTRARGLGADDMLVTRAGLWIASDNLQGSDTCGGVGGHAGICLPPYS